MTSTTAARSIAIKDAVAERVWAGSMGPRRLSTASRICTDDEGNRVQTRTARFRARYRLRRGDGRLELMDLPHRYLRLTSLVASPKHAPTADERGTTEMGVADHVLESITGHLSRRMLEHYSHIRTDAKRQALDALDVQRGRVLPATDNGDDPQNAGIEAIIDVPESVASQSRHSLTFERLAASR